MEKIWLKSYPESVPAEVDVEALPSLKALCERSFARFRERPAFTNMGKTLSYDDLDRLSRAFAAYLQHDLGLKKGDRVAVMLLNLLQYPVALLGILRAGLTVVNVNPLYTPRELEHQLKDAGAETIIVLENYAHTLEQVLANTPVKNIIITGIPDLLPFPKSLLVGLVIKYIKKLIPAWHIPNTIAFKQALASGSQRTLTDVSVTRDDIAFLQYTGGTTGIAKGAILTHGNMVANVTQASAWLKPCIEEGEELIVTALPLYHIFSLTANCLAFMNYGAHNLLITNPRDMPGFVKELGQYRFTAITGVNTLFNGLLNTSGFDRLNFSALKLALGGGMAVQQAVADRWKRVTGVALLEAYGLTETSPGVCINPLHLTDYTGCIGLPIPSTEISIRNDDGEEVPLGEPGELCVRGPQVMAGYWQRPDETAKVMTKDGFFRTGDIATIDERGYVRIVDRKKDMILVSGFNVYPNEIEDVAALHPGVLEVAAVGVPDERCGERIKLVVVKKDPALTPEELIAHCRQHLTSYKIPRQVEFRRELPKTNVGKILRRALRDSATN